MAIQAARKIGLSAPGNKNPKENAFRDSGLQAFPLVCLNKIDGKMAGSGLF